MKKSYLMLLLVAMFALVACDNNGNNNGGDAPQKSEHEIAIENFMAQCNNFDATTLTQGLVGLWETDTEVAYDEEWQKITDWYMVIGEYNNEIDGWSRTKYEFTADGKGLYHFTTCDPTMDCTPWPFDWHYDAENNKLMFSGEYYNGEFDVKGYNGEYIILDHYDATNKRNKREIFKRISEN